MKSKAGGILSWLLSFAVVIAMMPSMVFADSTGAVDSGSTSFDATCTLLYDIHGEVDITGIKVETDSTISATACGVKIGDKEYPATSPLKGGSYVVDITGLDASKSYTAKPYYTADSKTYYGSKFEFSTTAQLQTQYWQVSNYDADVMRTYNKTEASSVGFSIKRGTRKSDQNYYRMDICGISGGKCVTTSYCCLGSQLFIGNTSSRTELSFGDNDSVKLGTYSKDGNQIDVWQVPEISEDGKLVTITYYVRNVGGDNISDLNLGVYTQLMVGNRFEDDMRTGAKMTVSRTAYGVKVERRDTAYALALNNGYSDTPVSTSYIGDGFSWGSRNVFGNNTISSYTDSWPGLSYSWNLGRIKSGEMKTFTVTADVESSSNIDKTIKDALADEVLAAGTSTNVKTKNGNIEVKNTGSSGTVTVKKSGIVVIPADSIATINGIEYKAATGGAKFKVDKQTGKVTLTEGSIILTKGGPATIGDRVIESTGDKVTINKEGITLPPDGEVTVDGVIYKNEGTDENISIDFGSDSTNTLTLPAYGTATIGDETYTAGKDGATIVVDKDGKSQVTAGSVWLDGDATIAISGIDITNEWDDTIAVYGSENGTGRLTIPANTTVSVGGREISGSQDIQITVDEDKKASINIPDNGSVKIDGEVVTAGSEAGITIAIDKDGNVATSIPAGKSITVGGTAITGDATNATNVEINKNGATVTIPANGTVTIGDKTYANGDTKSVAKVKVTTENDKTTYKLLSGTVTLKENESITVGDGDTLVTNTTNTTEPSENKIVISVTAHDTGAYVEVPVRGSFKAGNNTGANTSTKESAGSIKFEIDANSDLYISSAGDDQKATVNGSEWKWLELSGAAAVVNATDNTYTTSVSVPKQANGKPFAVYSISMTGGAFTVSNTGAQGGYFSNGQNNGTSADIGSPMTSVQYTVKNTEGEISEEVTVDKVEADLSKIVYKNGSSSGEGTITVTATKYAPKTGAGANGADVYYNGHYYRLSNKMAYWYNAMNATGSKEKGKEDEVKTGDTDTYQGYKSHPITATTAGENAMLITLLNKCTDDEASKQSYSHIAKRIWLGAVPSGATAVSEDSTSKLNIPNATYSMNDNKDYSLMGTGWKWIWGTPEGDSSETSKNVLPSNNPGVFWQGASTGGQPDGSTTSPTYVIYIGISGPYWDDLALGNATTSPLYKAYYVMEYSPWDSTTNSWIYESDGYTSKTSGFSSVQSVSKTYNNGNIGVIPVGESMVGCSGKTIGNTSASGSNINISVKSENSVDTVTIPTAGGKVTIDGTEYTARKDNTILTVTKDGVTTLAQSTITVNKGKTIQVGDEVVKNTGDEAVTIVKTADVAGYTATIPEGGEIKIVKDGKTTVIKGDANSSTTVVVGADGKVTATVPDGGSVDIDGEVYKDSGDKSGTGNEIKVELDRDTGATTVTVPTAGDKVTIGDAEYVTTGENTGIKVVKTSTGKGTYELVSGGVNLDQNETIKVSDGSKTVDVKNTSSEIIAIAKNVSNGFTATVPVDGALSVGDSTFENHGISTADIGVGTDGTLTLPATAEGKVSGNIIIENETSGTKVEIPTGKTYYVEDESISGYTAGDKITINGVTRELTGNSFLLADSNTLEKGEKLTVEGGGTGDAEITLKDGETTTSVTVPKTNIGKTTVTWNEVTIGNGGGSVTLGNNTYTAGTDGATFTFDEGKTGLILTDGSAEVANGKSLTAKIGGKDITIEADNSDSESSATTTKTTVKVDENTGTGTVTTNGQGEVTIAGTVYTTGTSGATFTIDENGAVKVTGGSASVKGSSTTDISVGDKTITIEGANEVKTETDGSITVKGLASKELKIGGNTYTTGAGGATFTIGTDGQETLTAGSAVINANSKINVGQGKATVVNGISTFITVTMTGGAGAFTLPAEGNATVNGVAVGGAIVPESDDESGETTKSVAANVTIAADGTATMIVPTNGSITVGGKTISGPAGTTVKVSTDGKITVVAPATTGEGTGNVDIKVKETVESGVATENVYSVKAGTQIDITETSGSITGAGSSVILGQNKEIKVSGTEVVNKSTETGKEATVTNNGDSSTVTVPAGGAVSIGGKEIKGATDSATTITIDSTGKATVTIPSGKSVTVDNKTIYGPNGTNVEIDKDGNMAIVAPASTENGAITIKTGEGDDETATTYTTVPTNSNGDTATTVGQEQATGTNAVPTRIELNSNGNKLVQGGVKLSSGQTIIGGSGQTVTGTGTGDGVTVRTSSQSGEDTVTVANGSGVTIKGSDGTTCTAANGEATLAVYKSGSVQLTSGSVSLSQGEIYDGYRTIEKGTTGDAVTVAITKDGDSGKRTGATTTIPDGSSATVGGQTIKSEAGNTSVGTNDYGETIVTMGENGKVAIGSENANNSTYEATAADTQVKVTGSTNELVKGTVKLSNNAEIIANRTTVKGISDGTTGEKTAVSVTTTQSGGGDQATTTVAVTIPAGGSAEVGGKVIEGGTSGAAAEIASDGTATIKVAAGNTIKVGGKKISGASGSSSTVTITPSGEVKVTIPSGGSITVDGEAVSGGTSGTVIKIDGNKAGTSGNEKTLKDGSAELDGNDYVTGNSGVTIKNTGDSNVSIAKDSDDQTDRTDVVTVTGNGNVTIGGTEYTVENGNDGDTTIKVSASGTEITNGSVDLDKDEEIKVGGAAVKGIEGTVTVKATDTAKTVTIPAGGSASINGKTIKAGAETTVTVGSDGSVTLNVPEQGITVGGKKITGQGATVTIDKDGKASVTIPNGVEVTVGGTKLSESAGATVSIDTTGTEGAVTQKSLNDNGSATLDSNNYITGNSGKEIKNTGSGTVSVAKDSTDGASNTDIVTVTGNGNVTIGDTEYTVKNGGDGDTTIKVSASGTELTGGSIELDKGEAINVGGVTVKSESGTVTATANDTAKTVTIPTSGSASINGKTIKASEETSVTVGSDGSVTLNVPEQGITVGGKKITGQGAKVTIDKDGNVTINANNAQVAIDGVEQTAGSDGVINLGGTTDSDDNERNSLVSGIVNLDQNKAVTGSSGETIRNLGSGNVTVGSDGNKDIVTMSDDAKVKIGDATYTAKYSDTTIVADQNGVEITKGSVIIGNGTGEVKIKGVAVEGKSGTVTVSATSSGSTVTGGSVTISEGGKAVIAGNTVTGASGGTTISIDSTGKATLNVANGASTTVNGATLTGTGSGSNFTLGTDGITVPENATVTSSDGKTAIKGVEKGAGANDTKVEVGTDGKLTLVAGKGSITGAATTEEDKVGGSTVSVKVGNKIIDVTIPAGKEYTLDADGDSVGTLNANETVVIGGVTYTAGSGDTNFSIKDVSLNTGDKAEVPASTAASIKLGSGDNAPEINVPSKNTGSVTIAKASDADGLTTITITNEGDSFKINGKTYTAEAENTTYTVDKNGTVTLTSGGTKVSVNKKINLGSSSYTAGSNGATVTTVNEGGNSVNKITSGSVKVDNGKQIAVGENNTIIVNKSNSNIEVGSDGSVTVPANGTVSIGGKDYSVGDKETVLKVGENGIVTVEQGTVTVPADATVKDKSGTAEITGIAKDEADSNSKDTQVEVGTDGKLTITEGKASVKGIGTNGSDISVKVGTKEYDVVVPNGKKYTIDTVSGTISELATGETVTIDGVEYTSDGTTPIQIVNSQLTNGSSASVSAGTGKTVKISDTLDVKVSGNNSGETKITQTSGGAQIELGESGDKITVGNKVYEAESGDTMLDVDSTGKVTLETGKVTAPASAPVKVGDTTTVETNTGNVTVEKKTEKIVAGDGSETVTTSVTVTAHDKNSTVTIGDKTYTATEKNTVIEAADDGNKLIDGGVSLDNGKEIIFGEKTIKAVGGNNVTLTVNTDGTAAAAIPASGKITIGSKEYEAGSSGATLIVDEAGNILIEAGTLKVAANSNITVGGNTYTADSSDIEIKGRGEDKTPAIVLGQDSKVKVELSNGKTATYTAANANTKFALAGDGSDAKNIELLDNSDLVTGGNNSALNFTDKGSYKVNGVTYTAGDTGSYTVTYGTVGETNCNKVTVADGTKITATMDKGVSIKLSGKVGDKAVTDIPFTSAGNGAALNVSGGNITGSGSYLTEVKDDAGNITGYTVTKYSGGSAGKKDNVVNKAEDKSAGQVATTTATIETVTNKDENEDKEKTTATVDDTTAVKIVDKAVSNNSAEVIIDTSTKEVLTEAAAGASTEIALPEKTVQELSKKTEASVTIKSDGTEITLNKEAVDGLASQAGDDGYVRLVVETIKQETDCMEVELKLVTSKGTVTDFKGGDVSVTVKLNDSLAEKDLVCVYIDENGTYHKVKGSKNDDGTYSFITGHFSKYAIMTQDEANKILAEQYAKVKSLAGKIQLKARSAKTSKANIKVTLKITKGAKSLKSLEKLGYTLKYKYYRSTSKPNNYKAKLEKYSKTYINTDAKKGTRYYYKARVMVYDTEGNLIYKTNLSKCKYTTRVR